MATKSLLELQSTFSFFLGFFRKFRTILPHYLFLILKCQNMTELSTLKKLDDRDCSIWVTPKPKFLLVAEQGRTDRRSFFAIASTVVAS